MEAKLQTVFWHHVVTCAFLLCCLCQLADSKVLFKTGFPSQCDPGIFNDGSDNYSVHFSKKTYKEAESFCQGCHGTLADSLTINRWLTSLKQQNCSSENIWVDGKNESDCPATKNNKKVTPGCDTKQIFICKEDPQSLCWAFRNRTDGIPFQQRGHFFRLYPQRKSFGEAVKFCQDLKGRLAHELPLDELNEVPSIKQMKSQLLWINRTWSSPQSRCELQESQTGAIIRFADCDGSYPFICEEARTISSCLKFISRLLPKFGDRKRYKIFLSKKTPAEATKECKKFRNQRLADWQTSKNAVKDFLRGVCSGPVLDEKIWFSNSAGCVVSLNTNLDDIQEEPCSNKHIFVCDHAS